MSDEQLAVADASMTACLLPFDRLITELGRVLTDMSAGRLTTPGRMSLPLPFGGTALIMPATDNKLLVLKSVTVCPANRARGLPSIRGEFLIKDAPTGETLLSLDAATVTKRRTAALTVLATQLAFADHASAAMLIGAGAQARAHADAFIEVLGVQRFVIVSRTEQSSIRLVEDLKAKGVDASLSTDAREAMRSVDLVLAATTSLVPVIPEDVPDRIFVAAVGAFRRDMAELPPALLNRREVIVDTLEGARSEAGDLITAAENHGWEWSRAVPLASVVGGKAEGGAVPRLFKSVGHPAFDLAAARTATLEGASVQFQ